jgi:hypothetical protein
MYHKILTLFSPLPPLSGMADSSPRSLSPSSQNPHQYSRHTDQRKSTSPSLYKSRVKRDKEYFISQYPTPDSSMLKSSKIGKAVMLLYRHPKESRRNREKAGKLVSKSLTKFLLNLYTLYLLYHVNVGSESAL